MPLAEATISFDIADLIGVDFDARRTKVWVKTNIPDETLVDTDGNKIRLGSGNVPVAADGTGSVTVWVPGAGANPASWQTSVHVEYADRNALRGRAVRVFGPYTITASANLADLIVEQEIPPTYLATVTGALSAFVTDAETAAITAGASATSASASASSAATSAAAASALVLSDLATSDGQMSALIENDASQVAVALNTTYATSPDLLGALPSPVYFSHRGGNLRFPEHSMEGYRASAASGFVVEADLSQLADGTLVCHHDDTIVRTLENKDGTATSGNVSALTRDQFLNLRIKPKVKGQARAVPVLWDDLLNELGGRAPIIFEVKPGVDTDAVWESVKSRGLRKSVMASSTLLTQCVEAVSEGFTAMLVTDVLGSGGQPTHADVRAAGVEWFSCSTAVSATQVPIAKAAGLKVIIYTPNTKASVEQQIGYGADGVFTDDAWFMAGVEYEQAADPFVLKEPWPHMVSTNPAYRDEWAFVGVKSMRRVPANAANYTNTFDMGWAGRRGPSVRIRWTAKYATGAAATTRYAGIAFGTWGSADTTYNHSATAGQSAYAFGAALNGEMNMWRTASSAAPSLLAGSLGSVAGPDIVPDVENTFEVVITPTDITFRNLTLGVSATATSTDTSYRPIGRLALIANCEVEFKDVWVETLP